MYYSSSDTSDMQIRIFLGNFLRYRVIKKKLSFRIRFDVDYFSEKLKKYFRIYPPLFFSLSLSFFLLAFIKKIFPTFLILVRTRLIEI